MTGKDPKDMTVSELLRSVADRCTSTYTSCISSVDLLRTTFGVDMRPTYGQDMADTLLVIADKIDAELAQARKEAVKESKKPMWWFRSAIERGEDWPEPGEGESFRSYLERCFLPRPRWDTGEVVGTDEYEDLLTYSVADDGCWSVIFADGQQEGVTSERVKRPALEVLGADGKPIVVGETVYSTLVEWLGTPLEVLGIENQAYVKVAIPGGKGWTSFIAANLTHTPPDTQEKIDRDKSKAITRYWECEDAECHTCPCRIDGKKPSEYYGTINCSVAQGMDIARRQAELDKRTGGAE